MDEKTLKVLEYHRIIQNLSHFCVSQKGKDMICELRPKTDKTEIIMLLQETDEALRMLLSNGSIPLEGFFDMGNIIRRAQLKAILNLKELLQLAATLRVIKQLKNYAKEVKNFEHYNIIYSIFENMNSLIDVEKEITRCVLSEEELSDRASDTLFSIRKQIQRKNQNIREKLNTMIASPSHQKFLQESLVTIRQERFVIPVKQEYRQNIPGIIHDQSSSGATLFIEPMTVVEMNNDLKKLRLQEEEEIERILIQFTNDVASYHEVLSLNRQSLLQLDVIFAKGKYALHINGKLPSISDEMFIHIKKARHPLIDPDDVVASDIMIGKAYKTLVITGPNTGGKTVTLKTVGLICLMMQTGLFIPSNDGSTLCIYQHVFADIGDEQSIEQSLSTFSSHMSNIVKILNHLRPRTLVLLDELGAGTDPTEGAALAMAILDYLREKELHAIVTTHYSELKQYAITQEGVENASVEFDVATLSPTYRLLIGLPGKSNAFEISKKLGLKETIINHSRNYLSQENIRFEDVLRDIENRRLETEEDYQEAHRNKIKSSSLLKQLEDENNRINIMKNELIQRSKEEALKIIESAKKEAQSIIKEMQKIKGEVKSNAVRELESLRRDLIEKEKILQVESPQESRQREKQKPFKPGDSVLLISLNQKGYILEEPKEDNSVLVQVGIMKTMIPIKELKHIQDDEKKQIQGYSRKAINQKTKDISNKIDVRGLTSEEMLLEVEKFIDNAALANLHEVTIIHGKGTGVLRDALKKLLKRNAHISDFRIGNYNEGGMGATIASLK
ncbi:MAG: endonuclease MutS2 [Eubacteriales bacterium]